MSGPHSGKPHTILQQPDEDNNEMDSVELLLSRRKIKSLMGLSSSALTVLLFNSSFSSFVFSRTAKLKSEEVRKSNYCAV